MMPPIPVPPSPVMVATNTTHKNISSIFLRPFYLYAFRLSDNHRESFRFSPHIILT
jgi:hypothetical protein